DGAFDDGRAHSVGDGCSGDSFETMGFRVDDGRAPGCDVVERWSCAAWLRGQSRSPFLIRARRDGDRGRGGNDDDCKAMVHVGCARVNRTTHTVDAESTG